MRLSTFLVLGVLMVTLNGAADNRTAEHEFTGLKIRFQTANLDDTIHFYRDVLDLQVVDQWSEENDAGVIFGLDGKTGTALLEFGQTGSPDNGAASVQLRVVDMARFLARLDDSWEVDGPHERPWGSVYTYLTDPNGVQVIVYVGTV